MRIVKYVAFLLDISAPTLPGWKATRTFNIALISTYLPSVSLFHIADLLPFSLDPF